jgi:hypothetical protein
MFPYLFTAFLSWRVEGTFGVIFTLSSNVGIGSFWSCKPERPWRAATVAAAPERASQHLIDPSLQPPSHTQENIHTGVQEQ